MTCSSSNHDLFINSAQKNQTYSLIVQQRLNEKFLRDFDSTEVQNQKKTIDKTSSSLKNRKNFNNKSIQIEKINGFCAKPKIPKFVAKKSFETDTSVEIKNYFQKLSDINELDNCISENSINQTVIKKEKITKRKTKINSLIYKPSDRQTTPYKNSKFFILTIIFITISLVVFIFFSF